MLLTENSSDNIRVVVTGAAGFIGSHLTERLVNDNIVVKCIDNLSTGSLKNLNKKINDSRLTFFNTDLRNKNDVLNIVNDVDAVFHFAADPDVRTGTINPHSHFENNIIATYNVLEAMRINNIKYLIFASSSTVYGDAKKMPTPENYSPLNPISVYGTSKLVCEDLIRGYVNSFNISSLILRPANIIGSKGTHGVILDFIKKLLNDPKRLEILGGGKQTKSYLHISDFINATMLTFKYLQSTNSNLNIVNVGNNDSTNVLEIAKIVTKSMGLHDVEYNLTGGIGDGRGWKGDVKEMLLSLDQIKKLGWEPSLSSSKAVELTSKELLSEMRCD